MQRIGKSFMLPIAILPIAGLLQGIAIALTNQSMIEAYQLESVLGEGTLIYSFMLILKNVASAIFDDLPLIFCCWCFFGNGKKRKRSRSVISSHCLFCYAYNNKFNVDD